MESAVFVMTDVVGSTALWEAHGDAMQASLNIHDDLVHGAIRSAGGRVFKHTGDGMIAVFDDADAAVAGALRAVEELKRAVWGATGPLRVRVSVHAGNASHRDGDFFGPAVNRVARINDVGNSGQVLVSGEARQLMSVQAGVDLGAFQLRDLSEPTRLWQFDDGDHPSLRTLNASRHSLPVMATEFLGRRADVEALRSMLRNHRLATITGAGGFGKTRLAVEVGAAVADQFPGGVWFVDLAVERSGDMVGHRVNDALGVFEPSRAGHAGPVDVLNEVTAGSATLVILDNCEHLIDDVAAYADEILARAPSVSMLATSREPLSVRGEHVWRIPDLHDSAVELFIARAAAAGVSNLAAHMDRIEEVCLRLDNNPLAIELAAARVASMSINELAERLDDRFSLLASGRVHRRPRQKSLKAMMDWSYELLHHDERKVLSQLSVFAGSFSLTGAEAVVARLDVPIADILDSLVAQSLVVSFNDSGRYRLLETVRLYALERLIEADQVASTRDRHLAWILTIAGTDRSIHPGMNWQREVEQLAEIENVISGMEWAHETGNNDAVLSLFRGSQSCWYSSGSLGRIGASWRDRIPLPPPEERARRAGWLATSGLIDFNLGEAASAFNQLLEAATIVDVLIETEPDGDWVDSAPAALYFRGLESSSTGDIESALRDADRLATLPQDPTGYGRWSAAQVRAIALAALTTDESITAATEAVEAARSVSPFAYAGSLALLGTHMYRVGRYEEALSSAMRCLEAPVMMESIRIRQVPVAARALSALGRHEEALRILERDFGPMLDAQRRTLLNDRLLGLTFILDDLNLIDRRNHLAAVLLAVDSEILVAQNISLTLVEVLGSEQMLADLPEPDRAELTPQGSDELVARTVTHIRELITSDELPR